MCNKQKTGPIKLPKKHHQRQVEPWVQVEVITPVHGQPGSWLVGCAQRLRRSWPMTPR